MEKIFFKKGDSILTDTDNYYVINKVLEYKKYYVSISELGTEFPILQIPYSSIARINGITMKNQICSEGYTYPSINEIVESDRVFRNTLVSKGKDHKHINLSSFKKFKDFSVNINSANKCIILDNDTFKTTEFNTLKEAYDNLCQYYEYKDQKPQAKIELHSNPIEQEKIISKPKNNDMHKQHGTQTNMIKNIFPSIQVGEVKNDNFRMGIDGIAIKNKDGEYISFNTETKQVTTEMEGMTFDFGKFFYLPVKEVNVGDLVVVDDVIGYVTKLNKTKLEISDMVSGEIKKKMPKTNRFGFSFYTKVVSMMDMFNGDDDDSIDPMLMMAMMNGGENSQMMETVMLMNMMGAESEMGELLPLMLMGNMNKPQIHNGIEQPANPMSQMLPLMMMGDNKDMKKILPLMMMMGQGGGDINSMLPMMMMMGGNEKGSSMSKMLPMMMMSGQDGNGSDIMANMMMMKFLGGLEKETKKIKDSEIVLSGNEAKEFEKIQELIKSGKIKLPKGDEIVDENM